MASMTRKVADRLAAGIKRLQPVVADAKTRDVGEADTAIIVTEILADVLGYDKFKEITSELAIKGTYCDLAIKLDGKVILIIEVKAIGFELKDAHAKQAVDYAANQGIEWVVLTNAVQWRMYAVTFGQPIGHDLVEELDFLGLNPKTEADLESLYLFTKEALTKSVLEEYQAQRKAMSRFCLGAMILSDPVLAVVRRELRKMWPDVKIEVEELRAAFTEEVLKRDVLEGERAEEARKKIAKMQRARAQKDTETEETPTGTPMPAAPAAQPPEAQAGGSDVRQGS
jgi:predicted type IV restriction endonuclease